MKQIQKITGRSEAFVCDWLTLPDPGLLIAIPAYSSKTGRVENQEFTAQKSGLVVKICWNTCCKENLRWFRVFERLLPVLGAAARRAYCPGRRFQETASTDRKVFSRTSTAIELKLRIKRFWPQGRAKRRKWGSGTDSSWHRGNFLGLVVDGIGVAK